MTQLGSDKQIPAFCVPRHDCSGGGATIQNGGSCCFGPSILVPAYSAIDWRLTAPRPGTRQSPEMRLRPALS